MIEKNKEFLRKKLEDNRKLQDSFFDFQLHTTVNLTLGQLNFFQSVGSVSLVVLGIGLGTGYVDFNIWSGISLFFALGLSIFTASFAREIIDLEANSLEEAEKIVYLASKNTEDKIIESFEKDDVSIYLDFIKEQSLKTKPKEDTNQELIYGGEFTLFVFYSLVLCASLSFFKVDFSLWILGIVFLFSYFLSFKDWSLSFIKYLSRRVSKK